MLDNSACEVISSSFRSGVYHNIHEGNELGNTVAEAATRMRHRRLRHCAVASDGIFVSYYLEKRFETVLFTR